MRGYYAGKGTVEFWADMNYLRMADVDHALGALGLAMIMRNLSRKDGKS